MAHAEMKLFFCFCFYSNLANFPQKCNNVIYALRLLNPVSRMLIVLPIDIKADLLQNPAQHVSVLERHDVVVLGVREEDGRLERQLRVGEQFRERQRRAAGLAAVGGFDDDAADLLQQGEVRRRVLRQLEDVVLERQPA